MKKTNSPGASRGIILEVGIRLLAEGGLEAVNTNVVAQAAGVGVGTFYRHFEDKYALLRAAVSGGLATLQSDLARADRAAEGASLIDQVRASVSAFVAYAERDPNSFRVIFSVASSGESRTRTGLGFSPRALERRLRDLQSEGELDTAVDPALAARAFHAAQAQAVLWWVEQAAPAAQQTLIETLVRLHPAIACRG